MKKEFRKKAVKLRRNFFGTLLATIALWILLGAVVYFTNPDSLVNIFLFLLMFFFATLFTLSTILTHTRKGMLVASALTIFLILRILGVGNLLNFILLIALAVAVEIYFQKNNT
jgi:hypothetical protein